MRTRYLYALALVPLGVWLPSCDSITTGQLEDDPGNPVLLKIMVQDERPSGGRNLATDLLDQRAPIACSDTMPCPANNQYEAPSISAPACIIPDGQTMGVCPDPLNPTQTPPAIGTPIVYGGNQIRLVFNKVLSSDTEDVTKDMTGKLVYALHDPTVVGLYLGDKEVATSKYYDATGSPSVTSDIFLEPYGPALVLKPKAQLAPGQKYTIKITPASIKDKKGQPLQKDVNGDIKASYDFTTEALYPVGGSLADLGGTLAPNDAVVLVTNALFDPSTLKVTVKLAGAAVKTVATDDLGGDPTKCADNENPGQLDVFPVDGMGKVTQWAAGDYTIDVVVASLDNPAAALSTDAFGKTAYTGKFTVKGSATMAADDMYATDNFVTPDQCVTPGTPDMAMETADMATAPTDGGVTDGANGG